MLLKVNKLVGMVYVDLRSLNAILDGMQSFQEKVFLPIVQVPF